MTGKFLASVPGAVLVGVAGSGASAQTPPQDRASAVVTKVAQALSKPGIHRDVVFKGKKTNVYSYSYSYSVDVTDTSRVVREGADGKHTVGRLVGDKFVSG